MIAHTLSHPVLVLFTAAIVDTFTSMAKRVSDRTNTTITAVTETPLKTSKPNNGNVTTQITISTQNAEILHDVFEVDSDTNMTPRVFLEQLQEYGLITPANVLKIKRSIGAASKTKMVFNTIPAWVIAQMGLTEQFDNSLISFLNLLNGGSITKAIKNVRFQHVTVVDNDKVNIGSTTRVIDFDPNTFIEQDVVTFLVVQGAKVAIPVFVTANYNLSSCDLTWTPVTYGTRQFQAISESLVEGSLKLEPFGYNRAIFSRIGGKYFALMMIRQQLVDTDQSTRLIDSIIANLDEAVGDTDRFLKGMLQTEPKTIYGQSFGDGNNGNYAG